MRIMGEGSFIYEVTLNIVMEVVFVVVVVLVDYEKISTWERRGEKSKGI